METKSVSIRMPLEIVEWLRERAARETIRRKQYISLNAFVVEVLQREMDADPEKGRV